MPEIVCARWTCRSCGGAGSVSGPRTPGISAFDPVPINCFFCFRTVVVDLPPELDPHRTRVEGEHGRRAAGCLCGGDVQEYWDGAGTALAVCLRCAGAQRRPAAVPDDTEGERRFETPRESIDRRRIQGGWPRPLKAVFAEIRAEATTLLAKATRPWTLVAAAVSTRTPRV